MNKLTVIMAIYGNSKYLKSCLDSIRNTQRIGYDICIVNTMYPRISLATAWNSGAISSRSEYLLFLNDDTLQSEDSFESLIKILEKNPKYGCVSPSVSACGYTPQKQPFMNHKLSKSLEDYTQTDVNQVAKRIRETYNGQIKQVSIDLASCCLMMKRETWLQVGGFHEGYFPAYGEDNDFIDCMICGISEDFSRKFEPLYPAWVKDVYCHHIRAQTAKIVPDLNRSFTTKLWLERFKKRHGATYQEWRKSNQSNA